MCILKILHSVPSTACVFFVLLFFFFSSNGKSVAWSQNDRSYRPNLWKRMSFHIKKKEAAVEVNQTAIIKPFSKDGDEATEAEPGGSFQEMQPSHSPLTTVSQQATKARGLQRGGEALPAYAPEQPAGAVRRRGGDDSPGTDAEDGGDISVVGVGDIGMGLMGGQPVGATIMDQISCVVNRFTANISELNTMMLPGGAPPTSAADATDTLVAACPSQFLPSKGRAAATTVTTYAEVVTAGASNYSDNRPGGKIYEHLAGACVGGRRPKDTEELLALTPPSPFRDSSLSSEGSSTTSASPTSEVEYDQLLLRHFSQSSSSL